MAAADAFEALNGAIDSTPLIDNHCHNLAKPDQRGTVSLLSIASEAQGHEALEESKTSLAHIRATNYLAAALGCEHTWTAVESAVEDQRTRDSDAWTKRCLQGFETLLLDDGFGNQEVIQPYSWHNAFVNSKCKRIVRLETLARDIFVQAVSAKQYHSTEHAFNNILRDFNDEVIRSIEDPDVVGFKSIICYRGGLDIPKDSDDIVQKARDSFEPLVELHSRGINPFKRPEQLAWNHALVHITAQRISESEDQHKKPIQFHTGLGDNDITLTKSSPAHLQPFISQYPTVPIVLLHSSYPWTREAGYLATMYPNVYADIGEVFPFLNQDGQEGILRQILELTPWSKILLSTDGHAQPEMYLIASAQERSVLKTVIGQLLAKGQLNAVQAIQLVQDIMYNNSNQLYNLNLKPLKATLHLAGEHGKSQSQGPLAPVQHTKDLQRLTALADERGFKWLRILWHDYSSSTRCRLIPLRRVLSLLQRNQPVTASITKSCLGFTQVDMMPANLSSAGVYNALVDLSSAKIGPAPTHISTWIELREEDGSESGLCPKTALRKIVENAKTHGLEFLMGFELEFVIVERNPDRNSPEKYLTMRNDGHAWSMTRVLADTGRPGSFNTAIDEILDALAEAGIDIEMLHPESALGQYEIVLPPKQPMEACEDLLYTREILAAIAARHGYKMTVHPKPFSFRCGSASHMHLSIATPDGDKKEVYESFYAGILKHLPALIAFTYSNPTSYERMVDSAWAGGRWVTWGTQNKESPLRKCKDSHWELKVIDGIANPYFVTAAVIAAGTHGFVTKEELKWRDCLGDPARFSESERKDLGITTMFPKDLRDALKELQSDLELVGLLGKEFVQRYVDVKEVELSVLEPMGPEERRQWVLERY